MRPCSRCKIDKPPAERGRDTALCKACKREYSVRWYAKNRAKLRAQGRRRRIENLERSREKQRAWRAAHREEYNAYFRRWNVEHRAQKNRNSRASHARRTPERVAAELERLRLYRIAKREHRLAYDKLYRQQNIDRVRLRKRLAQNVRKHRLRLAGPLPGPEAIQSLYASQGGQCAYCRVSLTSYHIDHIIPVSRGGTHALANLCCACPPCNSQKNALTGDEYRARMVVNG